MSIPAMKLTLSQEFDLVQYEGIIDRTDNVSALQDMAKGLLQAWQTQRAATDWIMRQSLGRSTQTHD